MSRRHRRHGTARKREIVEAYVNGGACMLSENDLPTGGFPTQAEPSLLQAVRLHGLQFLLQ